MSKLAVPQLAMPQLAVVIPARNEAARLPLLLADLARCGPLRLELIVVDGGSSDGTAAVAQLAGARVLASAPGRGQQLAAGVAATSAPWLLLLHADARLPADWAAVIAGVIAEVIATRGEHPARSSRPAARSSSPAAWYFDLAIEGAGPALRLLEAAVALRSRWRQLPYGDQGLLLPRALLLAAGGVRPLPLMEDLELVQRLRRQARLLPLKRRLRLSDRRWRQLGVLGAALANARLRRAWRRGVSEDELASLYYGLAAGSPPAPRCCHAGAAAELPKANHAGLSHS
ncbi:MAG: TIGR04283 family arsenosugar biosynthesis glycosyltransferase, partial [Prochlorococcaceae cyanobacterium]